MLMRTFGLSLYFVLLLHSMTLNAQIDLDDRLGRLVRKYRLEPIDKPTGVDRNKFEAGRLLFDDDILSGNRNISCHDCHNPQTGTAESIPFSIGQGRIDRGIEIIQDRGEALRRNSMPLFNLGHASATSMFWDGRVRYRYWGDRPHYVTPEAALNGPDPKEKAIIAAVRRTVDVQALFPIVSRDEMRGYGGENEVSNAVSNVKAWDALVKRVVNERPEITEFLVDGNHLASAADLNIGHIGNAIGEFVTFQFYAVKTPYDLYLKGNQDALSIDQKKGLEVFLDRGQCVFCHSGPLLSNNIPLSTGVPVIRLKGKPIDRGAGDVDGNARENFRFRTPPLRNVALTAPYMRNGVFQTLEEVVEHYDDVSKSLSVHKLDPIHYNQVYREKVENIRNSRILSEVYDQISPLILGPLRLNADEKKHLVEFLRNGLTDKSYLQR